MNARYQFCVSWYSEITIIEQEEIYQDSQILVRFEWSN